MDLGTTYFRTDVECGVHPPGYHRYPDDLDGGTWEEGRQAIEDFDWGDRAQCKSPDISWEEGLQEIEDFDWGEEPRVEKHMGTDEVHDFSRFLNQPEVTPQITDDELADAGIRDARITDISRDLSVRPLSEAPAVQHAPVGSPPWVDIPATEIDGRMESVMTSNTDAMEPMLENVLDMDVQEEATRTDGTSEQITKTTNAFQSTPSGMVGKDTGAKVPADEVHVEPKPATEEVGAQTFSKDNEAPLNPPTNFETPSPSSTASSNTLELGSVQGHPLEEKELEMSSRVYQDLPKLSLVSETQEPSSGCTPRAPEVAGKADTVAAKLPQHYEEDTSVTVAEPHISTRATDMDIETSIECRSATSSLQYDQNLPELPGFPPTSEDDEIDALFSGIQAEEESECGEKSDAAVSDAPLAQDEAGAQFAATNDRRWSIFAELEDAAAGIFPENALDASNTTVENALDATLTPESTQMDRISLDLRYGPDNILVPNMARVDGGDENLLRELAHASIQANEQDKTFASDPMKLDIGDGDQLGLPKMPRATGAEREDDTDTFSELSNVPSHKSQYEVPNPSSTANGSKMGGDNNKGAEATDNTHRISKVLDLSQHKSMKPAIPSNALQKVSGEIEPAEPNEIHSSSGTVPTRHDDRLATAGTTDAIKIDDVDGGDNVVSKNEDNGPMDLDHIATATPLPRNLLDMPLMPHTSRTSTNEISHTATHLFPPRPLKSLALKTCHELKRPRFLSPEKPFSNEEDDKDFKPESGSDIPAKKKIKTKGEKGVSITSRPRESTADKKKGATVLGQKSTAGDKKPAKRKKQEDKPEDDESDIQDEDLDATAPSDENMDDASEDDNTALLGRMFTPSAEKPKLEASNAVPAQASKHLGRNPAGKPQYQASKMKSAHANNTIRCGSVGNSQSSASYPTPVHATRKPGKSTINDIPIPPVETGPARNRMSRQHTNSNATSSSLDSKLYLPYGRRTTRGDTKIDIKRPNYKVDVDVDGDSDSNNDSCSSSSDISDSASDSTTSYQHTPSTSSPLISSKAAPKPTSKAKPKAAPSAIAKPKAKATPATKPQNRAPPRSLPTKNKYGYPIRATRAKATRPAHASPPSSTPGPGRDAKDTVVRRNDGVTKRSPPKKRQTRAAAAEREKAKAEQEKADNIGKRTRRADKEKRE